jgi:hypothetical protein
MPLQKISNQQCEPGELLSTTFLTPKQLYIKYQHINTHAKIHLSESDKGLNDAFLLSTVPCLLPGQRGFHGVSGPGEGPVDP